MRMKHRRLLVVIAFIIVTVIFSIESEFFGSQPVLRFLLQILRVDRASCNECIFLQNEFSQRVNG